MLYVVLFISSVFPVFWQSPLRMRCSVESSVRLSEDRGLALFQSAVVLNWTIAEGMHVSRGVLTV